VTLDCKGPLTQLRLLLDDPRATGDVECLSGSHPAPFVTAGFRPWNWVSPVGWLFGADETTLGTCFLIADNWIATAGHVLRNEDHAATCVVAFNFLIDSAPYQRDCVTLMPEEDGFIRHATDTGDLDFCFVRVRPRRPGVEAPGKKWGYFNLNRWRQVRDGTPITLIHHPNRANPEALQAAPRAQHFKCASYGALHENDRLMRAHSACSTPASSGGPVLAPDGSVMGIHYGGGGPRDLELMTPINKIRECLRCTVLTPEQALVLGC